MRPYRWNRRRIAKRAAIGLAVLGFVVVVADVVAIGRANRIVNQLLRDWAAGAIAQLSDSAYQFVLSPARFNPALRRVTVDSLRLTTRLAVNDRRPQPLPGLNLSLYHCTISGVHVIALVRRAGLIAGSFGCRSGSLMVEVPRAVRDGRLEAPGALAARTLAERQAFLVFQQGIRPPTYAPRVRIARVLFPRLALELRLPRAAGGATRLQLERLQWSMTDLAIDPSDTTAAARPLFSRSIEFVANSFLTHPDHRTALRVALLRTNLTDSTLEVRGVGFAPSINGAEFARLKRHDLIRLAVGRVRAQGIDIGAFILGQGLRARRVELDSVRLDVTADKPDPPGPPGRHRTPQLWIASLDESLSLDTLLVRRGQVVYREHTAGRDHLGVVTFEGIEATLANLSHYVGRRTRSDPMTLAARAQLQGAGQLDVQAVVPIDAPRFDMAFRGMLGAMSAPALNSFVVETNALKIERGQVAGVAFSVVVRSGMAVGTITPRFNDLAVSVTRSGSTGLLGSAGILGGAARTFASFAARTKLRADNPDTPESQPRSGAIAHAFTPDETLIAFVWVAVRDGLLRVVKK